MAGLSRGQSQIVRVQASRAVFEFTAKIPEDSREILVPFMPRVLENLLDICNTATSEVLCLLIEVITECVNVDDTALPQFAEKIVDLVLNVLQQYNSDPHVCCIVEELVSAFAERVTPDKREIYSGLFTRLTPFLVRVLSTSEEEIESDNCAVTNSYISICFDITTRFVRSLPPPIPDQFIAQLYPVVVEKTLGSTDTQVIQCGGETVRGFFAKASPQICAMPGGLEAGERVILHLLEPNAPEYSASFAGRLVTLILTGFETSSWHVFDLSKNIAVQRGKVRVHENVQPHLSSL